MIFHYQKHTVLNYWVTGRIFETIDFTEASKSFIYNFLSKAVKNEKTIIVLRKSRY